MHPTVKHEHARGVHICEPRGDGKFKRPFALRVKCADACYGKVVALKPGACEGCAPLAALCAVGDVLALEHRRHTCDVHSPIQSVNIIEHEESIYMDTRSSQALADLVFVTTLCALLPT